MAVHYSALCAASVYLSLSVMRRLMLVNGTKDPSPSAIRVGFMCLIFFWFQSEPAWNRQVGILCLPLPASGLRDSVKDHARWPAIITGF
jgi:hypothetical protein